MPERNAHRLIDAVRGDDPLGSAKRALDWIDHATLADLHYFAVKPEDFPQPAMSGFGLEFSRLFLDAYIQRWLSLDQEDALRAARSVRERELAQLKKHSQFVGLPDFMAAMARVSPKLVLDRLPMQSEYGNLDIPANEAFTALGEHDFRAARKYLERLNANDDLHEEARRSILFGLSESDPLAAAQFAKEKAGPFFAVTYAFQAAEERGPTALQEMWEAAGGSLKRDDAMRIALRNPELLGQLKTSKEPALAFVSSETRSAADSMSADDRARTLSQYEKLPPDTRDAMVAALASTCARTNPKEAATWALEHAKPDQAEGAANLAANEVFVRWINNDADSALAWRNAMPPSALRDQLGNEASTYLAEEGRLDDAMALFQPGAGSHDKVIATQLAQFVAKVDPAQAASWVEGLPQKLDTGDAMDAVVGIWYDQDPRAVGSWLESLPKGLNRDRAVKGLAAKAAAYDPAQAAKQLDDIGDNEIRRDAAQMVYDNWKREDPAAARAWFAGFGEKKSGHDDDGDNDDKEEN
ncbi:MAG TPA: hypothetical protein VGH90_13340 [Chthoniobacteraceae bacterium]